MCECSFNDDFAKTLHLKGRRHRLNYKKNYDPTIKVVIVCYHVYNIPKKSNNIPKKSNNIPKKSNNIPKKSNNKTLLTQVDIQPSKREKLAEQRNRRRQEDMERRRNMMENRRSMWDQSRWRVEEEWMEWKDAYYWHHYDGLKAQNDKEYEEMCNAEKERAKKV